MNTIRFIDTALKCTSLAAARCYELSYMHCEQQWFIAFEGELEVVDRDEASEFLAVCRELGQEEEELEWATGDAPRALAPDDDMPF